MTPLKYLGGIWGVIQIPVIRVQVIQMYRIFNFDEKFDRE